MPRKLTREEVIEKASIIHNNKYDYSQLEYVNYETKVKIICPEHGEFFQTPHMHIAGNGCPYCGGSKKLTTEGFIQKAKSTHGDKYDYSELEYINNTSKAKIICPIHGVFFQTPHAHLRGQGCPHCGTITQSQKRKKLFEDFVHEADKIHNNKYSYIKDKYIDIKSKTKIICPEHGEFYQSPQNHLLGQGCPQCGINSRASKQRKSIQTFIEEANIVHNNKYNYSLVNYKNAITKVKIICPNHGEFLQSPSAHLNGNGCPKCRKEKTIATNLQKYGTEWGMQSNSVQEKAKKTTLAHFGVEYPTQSKEVKKKIETTNIEKYGVTSPLQNKKVFEKMLETKKTNGTFNTSRPEEYIKTLLEDIYQSSEHQYNRDPRYPFTCDFYIPERDLFIEYNGFVAHGAEFGWFNPHNQKHKERVEFLKSKQSSSIYNSELRVWTKTDPLKRETAKQNNLNYVVLWDEKDINKWFELGCPDGHDYDYEYSWIKDDKERNDWLKTKK